jgi:protein-disulfide isomerase
MTTAASVLTLPVGSRDHIRGPRNAPVTLVEYGDYECPYCSQAFLLVAELERIAGDRMCYVFRNFPLTNAHPHAELAAEAAEAAGTQGRFWEMHSVLYEHQDALEPDDLAEYAAVIGLDVRRFVSDLAEHRYAARVREDFLSGVRSGVNGTPTFFMNGLRYDGPRDVPSFLAAMEEVTEAQPAR